MTLTAALLSTVLGDGYKVLRELSGGGMSRLYVARDVRLDRDVVVKVLPPDLITETSIARFRREIALTTRLQHPHVVPIISAGEHEDFLYYITPFISGESLRERLARDGPLPLDELRQVTSDVHSALAYAHRRGVIHRDVKPGNVLLVDGRAMLADFGIARAISASQINLTGTSEGSPGTFGYVAPELPSDNSADTYALAVLVGEMLTGTILPPGSSAEMIAGRRAARLGERRSDVIALGRVLQRALSADPSARYQTIDAFADAVRAPAAQGKWRLGVLAAAVLGAAVLSGMFISDRVGTRASLDASSYVVLPFVGLDSARDADAGERAGAAVAERLAEWDDVRVVDRMRVREAMGNRTRLGWQEALRLTRATGARYLVWGEAAKLGDSTRVTATLYDASVDSALQVAAVTFDPSSAAQALTRYRQLVSRLLRSGSQPPASAPPFSLAAWREYDDGLDRLRRWDLVAAESSFVRAIAADSAHGPASLMLALTVAWVDSSHRAPEVVAHSRRALAHGTGFADRDSTLAHAMIAHAEGRYPAACALYEKLTVADSTDIAAVTGRGDCLRRDGRIVIGRAGQPVFQTGLYTAGRLYDRVLRANAGDPPPFVFERLRAVRPTGPNWRRLGRDAQSRVYLAAAGLTADTLSTIPQLQGQERPPASRDSALGANRRELLTWALAWKRAQPASVIAHLRLAELLEGAGYVTIAGPGDGSALDEIRRARELTKDSAQLLELEHAQVRMYLRAGNYVAARQLADTVLVRWRNASLDMGRQLGALAALTGRAQQLSGFLTNLSATPHLQPRDQRGNVVELTPALARDRADALAHAALGACGQKLDDAIRRIESQVSITYGSGMQPVVRGASLSAVSWLSAPCRSTPLLEPGFAMDGPARLQAAALAGQSDSVRKVVRDRVERSLASGGGVRTFDVLVHEAGLLAHLGDTTLAIQHLDRVLKGIGQSDAQFLRDPTQAGGYVRALALFAELKGSGDDAREAARAVVALWDNADPELQPVVARLRRLAQ